MTENFEIFWEGTVGYGATNLYLRWMVTAKIVPPYPTRSQDGDNPGQHHFLFFFCKVYYLG